MHIVPARSPQRPHPFRQEPFEPSVDYYPDMPSLTNPLRHSGRMRVLVSRPDNVYGNCAPIDILADEDDAKAFRPQKSQSPGPSGSHSKALGMASDTAGKRLLLAKFNSMGVPNSSISS